MILYRPIGLQELELIYDNGMKAFPARLPQQPIFYPVLDLEYARQVASDWNVKSGQHAGYVTQFKVEDAYIGRFEKHTVGGSQYQEFWIPAEEVEEFNRHITGHIKVLEGYFGKSFKGFVPEKFSLQGKNAVEQFTLLTNSYLYKRMDFYLEIKRNHKTIFLNYPFWLTHKFKNPGLKEKIIQAIKEAWFTSFPNIPLPLLPPLHEDTPPTKQIASRAKRVVDPEEDSILDTTDSHEPHLVNPDEEDLPPEEETDSYAQQWDEPEDDEAPSVRRNEPPSFVNPVRQEIRPEKPIALYKPHSVKPDKDDRTSEESSNSFAQQSVDPEDDAKSVKQSTSYSAARPVRPEITPRKQADLYTQHTVHHNDEEITPEESSDSFSLVDPDDETPSKSESHSSVNAICQEIIPIKQTSSYTQYLENHDDEDSTSEDPLDAASWIDSEDDDTPSTQQSTLYSSVSPVPREITPRKQTDANEHFVQGLELGLSGKYHEAIDELSKAVEENPNYVVARTSLGVAFHRAGDHDRALDCYEAALKLVPNDAEAHYFRANILYSQGNIREAIAGYTLAIGLEPELIEAYEQLVPQNRLTDYSPSPAEMHRLAKPARRILDLNKSLDTNPRQANLLKERAAEYERLSNYERAIEDYSASLALLPDDADALHSRGLIYEKIGQPERAQEDYQQAIASNPQLVDVYINRGVNFGNMGNFRQSIASLTEAIRLAPQNVDAYFNRGTSYFQLGDLENAMEDFSNVIWLFPSDEAAYYWRGVSHEEAGRQSEAIADYQQFLALSQDENAKLEIEGKLREWEKGTQDSPGVAGTVSDFLNKVRSYVSNRRIVPDEGQETNQVPPPPGEPATEADLYNLLAALGERALNSIWFGSNVECHGENAEELYALTEQEQPIDGRDLLSIASGIRQTIQGDFFAFDPGATSYWLFLRAWEGNGFYIETNDSHIEEQLKTHYQEAMEYVDGAQPPYAGLFIRI